MRFANGAGSSRVGVAVESLAVRLIDVPAAA
ncbi:hypothetical protein QFZ33_002595 [Arthrobacter globiformis]|nr:hypothetical protein [Arthrobacter globiformis]